MTNTYTFNASKNDKDLTQSIVKNNLPNTATIVVINGYVTIGNDAFKDCSKLTSITIPSSITSIGNSAFIGCIGLISIIIPNSVTIIGTNVFKGCSNLTSITIPSSITSIGNDAFRDCILLTSIIIPNSVTSIGTNAFNNCKKLTSIIIPNLVTSIGTSTFNNCTELTSIIMSKSVTSIGNDAFKDCSILTSITMSNFIRSIGTNAFNNCKKLTSIIIPNLVTSIGNNAFLNSGLNYVYMASNNKLNIITPSITNRDFYGKNVDIIKLNSPNLEELITRINSYNPAGSGGTVSSFINTFLNIVDETSYTNMTTRLNNAVDHFSINIYDNSLRIVVCMPDGTLSYDSYSGYSNTFQNFLSETIGPNHNTRPEIIECILNSSSEKRRYSSTSRVLLKYRAECLKTSDNLLLGTNRISIIDR